MILLLYGCLSNHNISLKQHIVKVSFPISTIPVSVSRSSTAMEHVVILGQQDDQLVFGLP